MRKLLGVTMSAVAVLAIGMAGTAQAGNVCPAAGGPTYERGPATSAPIAAPAGTWDVAGYLPGIGHGQADVNTTTVGYSGTLNSDRIGYGDIDARLIGGPSGEADGEINGVAAASGSLSGTTLAVQTDTVATPCISIP